jgi:hypothetical protein
MGSGGNCLQELATLALRYAVSARSGQLQVEAMQLLTALLRVPKDKQSDELKAALGKAMKKGLPSVVQHSVSPSLSPLPPHQQIHTNRLLIFFAFSSQSGDTRFYREFFWFIKWRSVH